MTARVYDFNRRAEGSPHSPPSVDTADQRRAPDARPCSAGPVSGAGPEASRFPFGSALNFDEPPEDGPSVSQLILAVARAEREGDEPRADLYQKVIDLRVRRAQVIAFPPKDAA